MLRRGGEYLGIVLRGEIGYFCRGLEKLVVCSLIKMRIRSLRRVGGYLSNENA